MDYKVELDNYNGPLDLLLFLIRRDELDIRDIPIAKITDSYVDYLHKLKEAGETLPANHPHRHLLDLNTAGEFLVMAATLMEIKAAMLVPREKATRAGGGGSSTDSLIDPRAELVSRLLEYKAIKDASGKLQHQAESHAARFARAPAPLNGQADEPPPLDMDEVQVWDLLQAFTKLMAEVSTRKPRYHEVTYDDTPIDLHAADIEDRLTRQTHLTLRELLVNRETRSEMIGVFLALLELIREKKVVVKSAADWQAEQTAGAGGATDPQNPMAQEPAADDFVILPAPEEHRKTYLGASLHLSEQAESDATAAEKPTA